MDTREVLRLLQMIAAKGHAVGYQQRSQDELKALGLGLITGTVAEYDPAQNQIMACTVIVPGEALTLPDNATAPCAWGCGRQVQFRPWVAKELPKVCLYCMAERPLEDQ